MSWPSRSSVETRIATAWSDPPINPSWQEGPARGQAIQPAVIGLERRVEWLILCKPNDPSSVIDLSGPVPTVVRVGKGDVSDLLA